MKMEALMIHLPPDLKRKLVGLRTQGYTASGYVRALIERDLAEVPETPSSTPRTRPTRAQLTRR